MMKRVVDSGEVRIKVFQTRPVFDTDRSDPKFVYASGYALWNESHKTARCGARPPRELLEALYDILRPEQLDAAVSARDVLAEGKSVMKGL